MHEQCDVCAPRAEVHPVVRSTPGAYGTLIFAACPMCDWRGRKRYPSSGAPNDPPGLVRQTTWWESHDHIVKKHGGKSQDMRGVDA